MLSSAPITIPGSSSFSNNECGYKLNAFDPHKSSPPDNWCSRLRTRLAVYDGQSLRHTYSSTE